MRAEKLAETPVAAWREAHREASSHNLIAAAARGSLELEAAVPKVVLVRRLGGIDHARTTNEAGYHSCPACPLENPL